MEVSKNFPLVPFSRHRDGCVVGSILMIQVKSHCFACQELCVLEDEAESKLGQSLPGSNVQDLGGMIDKYWIKILKVLHEAYLDKFQ